MPVRLKRLVFAVNTLGAKTSSPSMMIVCPAIGGAGMRVVASSSASYRSIRRVEQNRERGVKRGGDLGIERIELRAVQHAESQSPDACTEVFSVVFDRYWDGHRAVRVGARDGVEDNRGILDGAGE